LLGDEVMEAMFGTEKGLWERRSDVVGVAGEFSCGFSQWWLLSVRSSVVNVKESWASN